jgi:hypothetical protein
MLASYYVSFPAGLKSGRAAFLAQRKPADAGASADDGEEQPLLLQYLQASPECAEIFRIWETMKQVWRTQCHRLLGCVH